MGLSATPPGMEKQYDISLVRLYLYISMHDSDDLENGNEYTLGSLDCGRND